MASNWGKKQILRIPFFCSNLQSAGKRYKPVPGVAQQMEADSGTPDCMHIAFESHCRLHDKLFLMIYLFFGRAKHVD